MKKKVLITGGAGYIGSKISYDLTDMGVGVVIVDNLSTGHINLINPKSIFFKLDILDTEKISKIIKKYNISKIYHMAASLSVEESMKNKEKYWRHLFKKQRSFSDLCVSSVCHWHGNWSSRMLCVPNCRSPDTQDFRVLLCFHRSDRLSPPITCRAFCKGAKNEHCIDPKSLPYK